MNEPQQGLQPEPQTDLPAKAAEQALETAFAQGREVPFFDLDIQLIRRDSGIVVKPAARAATATVTKPTMLPTREQQALAALETLLKDRQRIQNPIARLPQAVPAVTPVSQPAPARMVMPHTMPAALSDYELAPAFVSPAVACVPAVEPLAAISTALVEVAQQIADRAADILPQLKLGALQTAIKQRESALQQRQQHNGQQYSGQPTPATDAAVSATAEPDELPWGHVTYRLLVM